MKKKTRPIVLLFLIAPCILLLAACFSSYSGEENDGTGSFTISIGGGSSRGILAWNSAVDSNNLIHEVTLTDSQGEVHFAELPSAASGPVLAHFSSLPVGLANITVEGMDASDVQAVGSAEVYINPGSNTKTITMGPPAWRLGARFGSIQPGLLTPIVNGSYTERVTTFTVEVFGFLDDGDGTDVILAIPNMTPPNAGLTFSGHDIIANANNGVRTFTITVNYDGAATVAGGFTDLTVELAINLSSAYSYSGALGTQRINIASGTLLATAIPLRQDNFVHFGAFASTIFGSGRHYRLTESIALSSWNPIGSNVVSFNGTFDGQGHTIDINNINPLTEGSVSHIGLFRTLSGSTVRNLRLTGSISNNTLSTQTTNAGAVTGSVYAGGRIENVSSSVNIMLSGNSDFVNVGGIAGFINPGIIENCYTTGNISATVTGTGTIYAGGIAGAMSSAPPGLATISFCWTESTVEASGGAVGNFAGGIVGVNFQSVISYCVALNGSLTSTSAVWRIAQNDTGVFNDNFGYQLMAPQTWNPFGHNTPNGQHVTMADAASQIWWEDSTVDVGPGWTFAGDKGTATANAQSGTGSVWWFGGSPARPRLWFD